MAKNQRKKDLAKIHIAKKWLCLDDDSYRAILKNTAGVESARDLSTRGRMAVLEYFQEMGWNAKHRPQYPGRPKTNPKDGRTPLMEKIEAHLAGNNRSWNYAHAMARRICKVERIQWCTHGQLHKIVAALEYDARRHGRQYRGR